jgi:two-component system chemotaxis response regulator CheB
VLWELSGDGPARFRCHVGHAYSIRTFAAEQTVRVEAALWAALRLLEENERLARRLADTAQTQGRRQSAKFHQENARSTAAHADVMRDILAHSGSETTVERRSPKPGKRR